jgi:predicted SAM-dependent methyltransferase
MTRKEKILNNILPGTQVGIEFGPLTSPIVTRDIGSVRYVDHATTEELRKKCASWGSIDLSRIVDVDYVWKNENLKELTINEAPFDYVIASHVVEHVPDFVGWFKEIRSILKPGGILSLAVPDKRFTFDYLRQVSTLADVLDAYLLKSKKPSARQIFDYKSQFVNRNTVFKWGLKEILIHEHTLDEAWQIAKNSVLNENYEDVHCWVFTEFSFIELLKSLVKLNLLDFKIKNFFKRTGIEFFINLEAVNSKVNKDELIKSQIESITKVQKEMNGIFRFAFLEYNSWKFLSTIRNLKKKFFP